MKYLEPLVKFFLKQKGFWLTVQGEVDSWTALHKYILIMEDFTFLIELAYECEIGKDTMLRWAEEVRREIIVEHGMQEANTTFERI